MLDLGKYLLLSLVLSLPSQSIRRARRLHLGRTPSRQYNRQLGRQLLVLFGALRVVECSDKASRERIEGGTYE
jgi:hypothetical protein